MLGVILITNQDLVPELNYIRLQELLVKKTWLEKRLQLSP